MAVPRRAVTASHRLVQEEGIRGRRFRLSRTQDVPTHVRQAPGECFILRGLSFCAGASVTKGDGPMPPGGGVSVPSVFSGACGAPGGAPHALPPGAPPAPLPWGCGERFSLAIAAFAPCFGRGKRLSFGGFVCAAARKKQKNAEVTGASPIRTGGSVLPWSRCLDTDLLSACTRHSWKCAAHRRRQE